MSKHELHHAAFKSSGVTHDQSLEAAKISPSLYQRLGEEGFKSLSTLFYDRVFNDEEAQWFLNIFSSSTKSEAVENQYRFFVQVRRKMLRPMPSPFLIAISTGSCHLPMKGTFSFVWKHSDYNICKSELPPFSLFLPVDIRWS